MTFIMNSLYRKVMTLTLLLTLLLASGCAAIHKADEEEGGISGTGNNIDCADERFKRDERCRP